ncbi:acyl-coa n-acyltransferase [Lucifera butyrica]|uniref:[Citrate [pro-3S]-lyase] ligase n=1 Tax=Lucifera butyrica TaxID=1351585 RepID=A0A498R8L8_9FIRM|nr:[citrate (pro-3S)-lyase] ligase [Lucifera butyrica]VBB06523.1 acyl-coa n-acyltransferase [Lucifera butyrica]
MWEEVETRSINLKRPGEVQQVRDFLARFDLAFSADLDYTIALYKEEQIVATGSLSGETLRNIAVDESLQGEGLTAVVVSALMNEAAQRGRYHYFLFTKPGNTVLFSSLGFTEIARAEPYAVLLEAGIGTVGDYCREIKEQLAGLPAGPRAGVVVNCNPFTRGHQALIAKAAKECASVVVMVVSEERSLVPFAVRYRLVREGVAEYSNVLVVPAGTYMVSAATFPGYFTKGEETVTAQTRLDAALFAQRIAPALNITLRYVGEEPYCNVTAAYNEALAAILPQSGVELRVVPRILSAGEAISASRVRELIRQDRWEDMASLVPPSTYRYLVSPEAAPVIERIKNTNSRH